MPDPQPPARPPLTPLRIVFATIGSLVALFAGGCSLYFLWILMPTYGVGAGLFFVALYGGIPIALGLLVTWLALRVGRGPAP